MILTKTKIYQEIKNNSVFTGEMSFQELFNTLPQTSKSQLQKVSRDVVCVDDRLTLPGQTRGWSVAGEGIGYKKAYEDFKKAQVTGIRPHKRCGAFALYAKKIHHKGDADKLGEKELHKLAKQLGIPSYPLADLAYNIPFHPANVTYVTDIHVNPNIQGMPLGFVISAGIITDNDYLKWQIATTVRLAQSHGIRNYFTQKLPYYLVAVVKNKNSKLIQELEKVAAKFENVVVQKMEV